MQIKALLPAAFALLALSACNKAAAPSSTGSPATVVLKDGSSFSGTVTKSDTSSITLQSSTGESRTYPTAEVTSVQYGPAPNADQQPAAAAQAANTPPPPPAYTSAPAPAEQAPSAPAAQYQPADDFRTIPAGTTIEVRNNQTISSEAASPGQTYSAVVVRNVIDTAGRVAIPHGAGATLVIHEARGQGEMQGRSELVFDVGSVNVDGRTYRLETSDFIGKGKEGLGENNRTGKFLGGGAALGGIIGAIAGGGKGAAIGALSGAGAGVATQGLTRGHAVRVPAETVMTFRLEAPIRIREMR